MRGGGEADLGWLDDVARAVRGAGYGRDVAVMLAGGARLACVPGRGGLVARGAEVALLVATDEEAATWLLRGPPRRCCRRAVSVDISFVTAGQDWAVRAGLEAGLILSPDGPVFTRGALEPALPWLPSGAFL